ncbi:MAG: hypothetical protein LBH70_10805 [Spirochaetaceae bacterium]|nr:hypothetical protein [Spirochaetaceae bacterium]
MKKVRILIPLLGVLILAGGVSCGSAPPPVEEPPAVEEVQPAPDPSLGPPDQAALDSLAAVKQKAEEARKRAFDFGGSEYAAEEWEAAENQYAAAGEQEKTDILKNTQESAARYEQAAAAFDDAFSRAAPQAAKALEEQVQQAREAALEAGAQDSLPDCLQTADDMVDTALELYAAEDYYAAARAGYLALNMFQLLKTGAETYVVWREIEDYEFGEYDPGAYDSAQAAAAAAFDGYDALPHDDEADINEVFLQAETAQAEYNGLLKTGWRNYSAESQEAASAARQAALEAGAQDSLPDRFQTADDMIDTALELYAAEDYSAAVRAGYLALNMFQLLKTGAETYVVWREIEDYGFGEYDPDTYDAAQAAAAAAFDGYDALPYDDEADINEIFLQAETAQTEYNGVLQTGWKSCSAESQAAASAARQAALDIKADVAVRNEYETAQTLYDQAETSLQEERYPEAVDEYVQSATLFSAAATSAAEKRQAAEQMIQEAQAKTAASDEILRQAEAMLGGNN